MNNNEFLLLIAAQRGGCQKAYDQLFGFLWAEAQKAYKVKNSNQRYSWDEVSVSLVEKIVMLLNYDYSSSEQMSPVGFAFTSLCNAVVDYHRKHKNRNETSFSEFNSSSGKEGDEEENAATGPEYWIAADEQADDELLEKEKSNVLTDGIKHLPLKEQEVMRMLLLEKKSQEEIKNRLMLSAQEFYNLKCQGKKKLIAYIRAMGY